MLLTSGSRLQRWIKLLPYNSHESLPVSLKLTTLELESQEILARYCICGATCIFGNTWHSILDRRPQVTELSVIWI